MATELLILIIGLAIGGAIVLFVIKSRPASSKNKQAEFQVTMTSWLEQFSRQMDRRLQENARAMHDTKSFVSQRVGHSEKAVREVAAGLGQLKAATAAIQKTNDEISSFQQMLRHPKIRGGFGEVLLANLLSDVLPGDRYQLQHTFPDTGDIADAIIMLQDGYIVAVDAKFPLANYQLFIEAKDPNQRKIIRQTFFRDLKKHISDISKKYISPQHHTLDYAFMYIPVEAIYYETMVHDPSGQTLWEFSLNHKVVPVSPNSFLAYLQTVLIGLRGMQIEEKTKEIIASIGQVRRDFTQFTKDYAMIGTHLTNAKNRYDDSSRRLDKFNNRLDQIDTGAETPQIEKSN